jgi:hypothetical protein
MDAILWLALLALPVATVAWTVTHEEIVRELREHCRAQSEQARSVAARKFFYVFTCDAASATTWRPRLSWAHGIASCSTTGAAPSSAGSRSSP